MVGEDIIVMCHCAQLFVRDTVIVMVQILVIVMKVGVMVVIRQFVQMVAQRTAIV